MFNIQILHLEQNFYTNTEKIRKLRINIYEQFICSINFI